MSLQDNSNINNHGKPMEHVCVQEGRIERNEDVIEKLDDQSRSYDIALTKLNLTIEDFGKRIDRHSLKIDGVKESIDVEFEKLSKELALYRKVITGDSESPGIAVIVHSHDKWIQNTAWKLMFGCAVLGGFIGAQVPEVFKLIIAILKLHVGIS